MKRSIFILLLVLFTALQNYAQDLPVNSVQFELRSDLNKSMINTSYYNGDLNVANHIFSALGENKLTAYIFKDTAYVPATREDLKNGLTLYIEEYTLEGLGPVLLRPHDMLISFYEEINLDTLSNKFTSIPLYIELRYISPYSQNTEFARFRFEDFQKTLIEKRGYWKNIFNNADSLLFPEAIKLHLFSADTSSFNEYFGVLDSEWKKKFKSARLNEKNLIANLQKRGEGKEKYFEYKGQTQFSSRNKYGYNDPFFFIGKEITGVLSEAVQLGLIMPYTYAYRQIDTSLLLTSEKANELTPMSSEEFKSKLIPSGIEFEEGYELYVNIPPPEYSEPNELVPVLEESFSIKNGIINSTPSFLNLIIPFDHPSNGRGVDVTVAKFKFSDCQKIFREKKIMWYNPFNNTDSLNIVDAVNQKLYKQTRGSYYYMNSTEGIYISPSDTIYFETLIPELVKIHEGNLKFISGQIQNQELVPENLKKRVVKNPVFKYTTKRMVDLRKSPNNILFPKDKEISRLIINAVKDSTIKPYDEKLNEYTKDDFAPRLFSGPELTEEEMIVISNEGGSFEDLIPKDYEMQDISHLEIEEEVTVNAKGKKQYKIKSVSLYVPAEKHYTKTDFFIAKFLFDEILKNKIISSSYDKEDLQKLYSKRKFSSLLSAIKNCYGREIFSQNSANNYSAFNEHYIRFKDEFKNTIFTMEKNKKYGLIKIDEKVIADAVYDRPISFTGSNYSPAVKNGRQGIIHKSGKIIIPIQYDSIEIKNTNEIFAMDQYVEATFDTTGKLISPWKVNEEKYKFYEGYALVTKKLSDWTFISGYIDKSGKLIIPEQFSMANNFSEGLAYVTLGNQSGYINKEGKFAFNVKYASAWEFKNGYAIVRSDRYLWGAIDKNGKEVVPCNYQEIKNFSSGLAPAKKDGFWGVINTKGEVIVPFKYTGAEEFSDGKARIEYFLQYAFIDTKGNLIEPLKFDEQKKLEFKEGLLSFEYNSSTYFIDTTGKPVIKDLKYENFGDFSEGRCSLRNYDNEYGYIDKTGKIVIPLEFHHADDFSGGFAVVGKNMKDDRKFGYINKNGKKVVPLVYDEANKFVRGKATAKKGTNCYLIDKNGIVKLLPGIVEISFFSQDGLAGAGINKGEDIVYGYIDLNGKWKIKPEFSSVYEFENGKGTVAKDGELIWIDTNGKIITE